MTISDTLRDRVREQAKYRCGYCQVEEAYIYAPMEIDHIVPKSHGGTDDEDNLWLACPRCNGFKGSQIVGFDLKTQEWNRLFNPCQQIWTEHFKWEDDGATIIGVTACGRATVNAAA